MSIMKSMKKSMKKDEDKEAKPSLAIAFDVQKRNKRPKMANGGDIEKTQFDKNGEEISKGVNSGGSVGESLKNLKGALGMDNDSKSSAASNYAEGGEICMHCEGKGHMMKPDMQEEQAMDAMEEHKHKSMVEAIRSKMNYKKLAEGGEVTEDEEEGPGEREHQNMMAKKFERGDDSQLESGPLDSNEEADEEEHDSENKLDMISMIRKKMKSGKK